jgi:MFS family permease
VLWAWASLPSITVLAAGVLLLMAFVLVERRAAEPILPGWVFRDRLLVTTSLASLGVGAILIGLTSYVPLYAQNVLGRSALVAGFALAALTLGWPIAASVAGRVYLRIGFRATALIGAGVALVSTATLALLTPASSIWQVGATCFGIGLGMGWVAAPTLIAAQASVDWQVRGVVTGTNMFARSMGSALGIAVFGAIANAGLNVGVGGHGSSTASGVPASLLDPALHHVFVAAAVAGVGLVLAVAAMPRTPATHS